MLNSTDGQFTVFAFDDVGDKVNSLLTLFYFVEYSFMLLYIYNLLYFIACILECDLSPKIRTNIWENNIIMLVH